MAKIFNGMIPFASAIQPTGAQPLDDRVVVATMADLIDATTFGDAKYNGMLVAVVETQQVYMLVDDVNSTNSDSWVPVGTDFSGDISDLSARIDTIDAYHNVIDTKLAINEESGLKFNDEGGIAVAIVPDEGNFINGLSVTKKGLFVPSCSFRKVNDLQYTFVTTTPTGSQTVEINIPKDQFLQNAEFITASDADVEIDSTVIVGDPYLKFTWQLDTDPEVSGTQNITYVPVKSLVDTYTAGTYVTVNENNEIDVNLVKLTYDLTTPLGIDTLKTNVDGLLATVGNAESGLVADVAKNTADIATNVANISANTANIAQNASDISAAKKSIGGLVAEFTEFKELGVVNAINYDKINGIGFTPTTDDNGRTIAKIDVDIDTLAADVIAAANIPDPIAANITVSAFGATYTENTNVQAVLESLDSRIKAAVSGGVTSVVAGVGINVNATDANNPTVSVKTSDLVVSGSALTVTDNKIDICWSEL